MKLKPLHALGVVLLGVGVAWLVLRSWEPEDLGVRVVGRTNDVPGRVQIIYEITNRTSREIMFSLAAVEVRTGAGWHSETNRARQREAGISRLLAPRSACIVRVTAPAAAAATRAELQFQQGGGVLRRKVAAWARRVGVPQQFMGAARGVLGRGGPHGSIKLPAADTAGGAFAKPSAGWPPEPRPVTNRFAFSQMDVPAVLSLYRDISGAELQVQPGVDALRARISLDPGRAVPPPELLRLIEQALREQAGVVMTRAASNRVIVSYEPTLKTKPPR